MRFYKIEVESVQQVMPIEWEEKQAYAAGFQIKSEEYFQQCGRKCYVFVTSCKKVKWQLGMIVAGDVDFRAIAEGYLARLDCGDDDPKISEIIEISETTFKVLESMLRSADHKNYVENKSEILDLFGLDDLTNGPGSYQSQEWMIDCDRSREALEQKAEEILYGEMMLPEIERIYRGAATPLRYGHPVHYLIQSCDTQSCLTAVEVLLSALYQNGRISNRRFNTLTFNNRSNTSYDYHRAIYKSSIGGAVVVTYEQKDTVDGDFAPSGNDTVEGICKVMRRYRNDVLTILCLFGAGEKTKQVFLENLDDMALLPLSAETVFGDKAQDYLMQCAKNQQIQPDSKLYETLGDTQKGHSIADLNRIFDTWFDKKLRTDIYAQYADFEVANRQVAGNKARGSAFSEMSEMIGLADAKAVINQALDFYKAQKLFKARGMTTERPAMHMVFTGNPGTAKTSVARLFAQIMKENSLLSEGDLIEVGRADLVGKYVGSTAPMVQKAFHKARGSVLFIDEAYSLVDDRDGLFGDEAINTIVQEMENNREDMVVIFAGYPDKMEGFLKKNPGLRSRIAFHVPFADYSPDELMEITALLAKKQKMSLAHDVADKLGPIFESAIRSEDFGNGRYARNLLEKARLKQASRLVAMDIDTVTNETIATLISDDFEVPAQANILKKTIGFCH